MPSDHRRIMLTCHDERPLRLLGLDPATAGAVQIWCALARFAGLVEHAGRELETRLDRAEWWLIADCLNGCADLWDYSPNPVRALSLVLLQVEDAIRLDGLDRKWLAEDPVPAAELGRALLTKLAALTPVHGEAILAAVRHFWRHPETQADSDWWRVAARRQPTAPE